MSEERVKGGTKRWIPLLDFDGQGFLVFFRGRVDVSGGFVDCLQSWQVFEVNFYYGSLQCNGPRYSRRIYLSLPSFVVVSTQVVLDRSSVWLSRVTPRILRSTTEFSLVELVPRWERGPSDSQISWLVPILLTCETSPNPPWPKPLFKFLNTLVSHDGKVYRKEGLGDVGRN